MVEQSDEAAIRAEFTNPFDVKKYFYTFKDGRSGHEIDADFVDLL